MKFADLRLNEALLRAVTTEGYEIATPIQAQSIPHILEGKDVLGVAQTGTGKTAAFALPILHRLMEKPSTGKPRVRCLVISPTRELATQIGDSFKSYGRHAGVKCAVIFGGVNQNPQVGNLRRGVEIVVATPGRLVDLMEQGHCDLSGVEVLVLDEADRMLDMGFIHDIRKIVSKVPAKRQTLFFSATMPTEIKRLAGSILHHPVTVQVTPVAATADRVEQCVYFVDKKNKPALLAHLVDEMPMSRAIVFSRTKHGADKVVRHLHSRGIRSEAIHGNKSQNARQRALENFKAGRIPVLVATDIASRGIDIDAVTHVVNYDLTHEPETYVHRIGRTARAGATGMAVSFCDPEERDNLRAIEKLIRQSIPVRNNHPTYAAAPAHEHREKPRHPLQAATPKRSNHPAHPRKSSAPVAAAAHTAVQPSYRRHNNPQGRPSGPGQSSGQRRFGTKTAKPSHRRGF
ncbi:MAG TPA: DEAD/DEAH box helicase [Tepidisphaeraceae bacterium]|nr:DEAD/DEAH box helicase [Tepidisphaeraceae bacterium]